ncbi:MAG: hypothetical protein PHC45_00605 [Clostridiaceae bacterium]|nr:hypothetical protein [Clostridiaceae bacterium]
MKLSDFIPVLVIIAALIVNIIMGVYNNIDFSVLMIRCIVVTIVFGIFGLLVTKTVSNIAEYYKIRVHAQNKNEEISAVESQIDIKVPPLDDNEIESIEYDGDNGFVEVNPANMGKYNYNNMD